ncbi:MAG: DNA-protecting protein DprA [Acidobacteria bacterium]|nr:DNA-protecting protein DprA [Acidobacteriota bacterium]
MDHIPQGAAERLALLLGGAGRRVRRAVGAGGGEPFRSLVDGGFPPASLAAARDALQGKVAAVLGRAGELGWRWVTPETGGYPELLAATADPPLGLFVAGSVPKGPAVAIVGSRRATAYGRQVAELLAREAAAAGAVVVSGMARGVDAVAHRSALEAGGSTVAVWGTGPGRVYPPEHRRLAGGIRASGALVSEYLPGTPPRRHHFPERNRIIAGMVPVLVVVEAAARSGALVTARLALDEGREVFAVPGSILSESSVGPNTLLRLGARPLLGPRELLDELGLRGGSGGPVASGRDDVLGAALPAGESRSVEELATALGMSIPGVLNLLLEQEMAGSVEREPDGRYRRTGRSLGPGPDR